MLGHVRCGYPDGPPGSSLVDVTRRRGRHTSREDGLHQRHGVRPDAMLHELQERLTQRSKGSGQPGSFQWHFGQLRGSWRSARIDQVSHQPSNPCQATCNYRVRGRDRSLRSFEAESTPVSSIVHASCSYQEPRDRSRSRQGLSAARALVRSAGLTRPLQGLRLACRQGFTPTRMRPRMSS